MPHTMLRFLTVKARTGLSRSGSKKSLAGIIFGLGMAMGAVNFLTWLFA